MSEHMTTQQAVDAISQASRLYRGLQHLSGVIGVVAGIERTRDELFREKSKLSDEVDQLKKQITFLRGQAQDSIDKHTALLEKRTREQAEIREKAEAELKVKCQNADNELRRVQADTTKQVADATAKLEALRKDTALEQSKLSDLQSKLSDVKSRLETIRSMT